MIFMIVIIYRHVLHISFTLNILYYYQINNNIGGNNMTRLNKFKIYIFIMFTSNVFIVAIIAFLKDDFIVYKKAILHILVYSTVIYYAFILDSFLNKKKLKNQKIDYFLTFTFYLSSFIVLILVLNFYLNN